MYVFIAFHSYSYSGILKLNSRKIAGCFTKKFVVEKSQHERGDVVYLSGFAMFYSNGGRFARRPLPCCWPSCLYFEPNLPPADQLSRNSEPHCLFAVVKGYKGTQCLCPAAVVKSDTEPSRYQVEFKLFEAVLLWILPLAFPGRESWKSALCSSSAETNSKAQHYKDPYHPVVTLNDPWSNNLRYSEQVLKTDMSLMSTAENPRKIIISDENLSYNNNLCQH